MPVETISCPNCGAPLRHASFDEPCCCLFCNSLIYLKGDAEAPVPSLERRLNAKGMNEIKQQLVSGQRQAAVYAFQELSGLEAEQASAIIDPMAQDFSTRAVFQQQLTRGGMVMVVICIILIPTSLLARGLGALSPMLSLVYLAMGCFGLYKYGRGALNTLRYRKAVAAQARILQTAQLGMVQRGRVRVQAYLYALQVMPESEPPFQSQTVIPVLEENVERLKKGDVIQVKYLPGQPDSVIFHRG